MRLAPAGPVLAVAEGIETALTAIVIRHTSTLRCTDGSAAATYRGRAA